MSSAKLPLEIVVASLSRHGQLRQRARSAGNTSRWHFAAIGSVPAFRVVPALAGLRFSYRWQSEREHQSLWCPPSAPGCSAQPTQLTGRVTRNAAVEWSQAAASSLGIPAKAALLAGEMGAVDPDDKQRVRLVVVLVASGGGAKGLPLAEGMEWTTVPAIRHGGVRRLALHRTRSRPDRRCTLAPRRLVARRDADAFANKFKRKWTRLCFCGIMVTEMRKRSWIRPTWGCVICREHKAGKWYRIKGCLNWCVRIRKRGMALAWHALTDVCSLRRVHEECGDRWRQEKRLQELTPMCPYGACRTRERMKCDAGWSRERACMRPSSSITDMHDMRLSRGVSRPAHVPHRRAPSRAYLRLQPRRAAGRESGPAERHVSGPPSRHPMHGSWAPTGCLGFLSPAAIRTCRLPPRTHSLA